MDHLVLTDDIKGLQQYHINKAIEILQKGIK